jgi:hypothetical protein
MGFEGVDAGSKDGDRWQNQPMQGGFVMIPASYVTWLVCQERNKDLLREAEQFRLVRQVLVARRRQGRFYGRALMWLGRRLVEWGRRLQERYDVVVDASPLPAAGQIGN